MIDIAEQDAEQIFKALADEHSINISINECEWCDNDVLFGLITDKDSFVHMCYFRKVNSPAWIEMSVSSKELESFNEVKHTCILDLVLNAALFSDIMYYDYTGEHVLIRKGTTPEELLIKADLIA